MQLGLLWELEIIKAYLFLSDHKLILINWNDIESQKSKEQQATIRRWSLKNLIEEDKLFEKAKRQ